MESKNMHNSTTDVKVFIIFHNELVQVYCNLTKIDLSR